MVVSMGQSLNILLTFAEAERLKEDRSSSVSDEQRKNICVMLVVFAVLKAVRSS